MKVAIVFNQDMSGVINRFGMQNKEVYNPETIRRAAEALETAGHNVAIIDGNMKVVEKLQEFMPPTPPGEKMGIVFNMAYGIQGENRYTHIPSLLEMLGIPYIGSSPAGHTLALDKITTKIILQKNHIPTPDYWVLSNSNEPTDTIAFPAVVKPKMEAVSFGLQLVHSTDQLHTAVNSIVNEFQQQALVEKFIRGREFAVGILGNNPPVTFPVLEIDLGNNPDAIQTVDDKKKKPLPKICPANLPEHLAKKMIDLSLQTFKALQLRDFARVDIRMDPNNNIYILEINSMASLGKTSSYVYAASVAGYDFKSLINKILECGIKRYFPGWEPNRLNRKTTPAVPLHVRLRSFLREHQQNIEKNLKKMVDTNTYFRSVSRVNELGTLITRSINPLGFKLHSIPQVEVGNILFFTNTPDKTIDVLLLAHIDNKTQLRDHVYYVESDQKLFGSGIWENKGGLAVMIAAFQALRYNHTLRGLRIGVLLTTDDTLRGKYAESHVRQLGENAKYVLGIRGSSLNGNIITSRSGAASYSISMNLKKSGKAEDAAWATGFFSQAVARLTKLTHPGKGLIISPWKIEVTSNIADATAHGEAHFSIRFNDPDQLVFLDKKIRTLIPRKYANSLDIKVEGGVRRPPLPRSEKTSMLWEKIKNIADKMDIPVTEAHQWSSADICFIDPNVPAIDALGPLGAKASENNEFILRRTLTERAAFLAVILHELSNPG